MKKSLPFFLILLLFSQCDRVENTPPAITHAIGQHKNVDPAHRGAGSFPGSVAPPALSVKANREEKKRTRRSRTQPITTEPNVPVTSRNPDSLFVSRLKYLRSNRIEPDLNERVSRNYLFSPVGNRQFQSMITLGRESYLRINFDNDILDYTDRFYTNGIKIEIISPGLQVNPLSRLTLPYWNSGTNYYGISLVQNMFTPSTTKMGGILHGDRPYAAYLYVGSFKITNDSVHKFRLASELDAGIIGPNSYGEWVQRSFHNAVPTNNEPLGWEYQVKNDLVLNYTISFEKGIVSTRNFEFLLSSAGNAGTLYTNLTGGGQLRTGWFNPFFANLGVAKKQALGDAGLRKIQVFLFIKGAGKLVGYDATLQGGIFDKSSIYTLPAGEISRVVFQGSGGISFSCNGIRLDLEQFMLSPEFHNGWWHKWVHVGLTFSL
ncbi:MAG: lipid A deacylase LpxR family protein [Bacteroidetes bacterium]|nr:lipid A deacylase LpxR family protein [Bacteroidota bacterium]